MRPWLSTVSVVKDDPSGLGRTFASLAAQDLDDTQVIVIDSSVDRDSALGIVKSFPRPVDYKWCAPEGIYAAMNEGLARAQGEFTYFANAGDTLFSSSVFSQTRAQILDSDWAFGPVEIVELDGRRVFSPDWDYESEREVGFSRGLFPAHQGTFARTRLLREFGAFDLSYEIAADYAIALALSQASTPIRLPFVVASFHEGGASTQGWSQAVVEFHRARMQILNPRGLCRVREGMATARAWTSSWTVRELRPWLKGAAR